MSTDKTDNQNGETRSAIVFIICFSVRVNSCKSVAWILVVGVGIEPTFRAFQTRANPSQLSDRKEGDEFLTPSAFARYAPYP